MRNPCLPRPLVPLAASLPRWLIFLVFVSLGCQDAEAPPPTEPASAELPQPAALLESGSDLKNAAVVAFTEGPAADFEGNVYFSEIRGNRILRYTPGKDWMEFRYPSRRSNGLAFDAEGRLVACEGAAEGGGRQVSRTDLRTAKTDIVAQSYEGKRLNSPNDLVIDAQGRIYFTDPRYGSQDDRELETEDVYRIDPGGTLTRVLTKPDIFKPNGIGISPDGKKIYVADTEPGPPQHARLMRFDIAEDGSLSNGSVHYSFGDGRGIDGLTIDAEGNVYGAAGLNTNPPENRAGVYVITPEGDLAGVIPVPEDTVTNCTFGGEDLRTLYVTAGRNLYEIRTKNRGYSPFR